MSREFEIIHFVPVSPMDLYRAWLSSEEHTRMTGGEARCSNRVGARFTAWDGYISGSNISLRPGVEIRQRWRTTDFKPDDHFSNLVLHLSPAEGGCTIHLTHSNIPDGQPDYLQGWHDHYFVPMDAYFSKK